MEWNLFDSRISHQFNMLPVLQFFVETYILYIYFLFFFEGYKCNICVHIYEIRHLSYIFMEKSLLSSKQDNTQKRTQVSYKFILCLCESCCNLSGITLRILIWSFFLSFFHYVHIYLLSFVSPFHSICWSTFAGSALTYYFILIL